MAVALYNPPYPTTPVGAAQPVNLKDVGAILTLLIKNPTLRADMFANVELTLQRMNYVPHPEVVAFFTSLHSANFIAAAEAFAPAHGDPSLGMAEC
jgi:hypothetical protein